MTDPDFLRPHGLNDLDGIVAAFSTRRGGVSAPPYDSLNLGLSTGDDRAHVLENRRRVFDALGFGLDAIAVAGQVHGDRVRHVEAAGLYPGYDGMVTATPGLALCISAADCAAVLLADAEARVVGACHAGWRGTVAGIVGRTIAKMEALGAERARLHAYVSPCISLDHFEVGPEVAEQFGSAVVHRRPGWTRPHVDLKADLAAQLEAAGVGPECFEVAPECTFAGTDAFFSYRAEEGETGRMMGVIGMIDR